VRIYGGGLPTHQIRSKSGKPFVDVRTDGRTQLSSNQLIICGRRWPKNVATKPLRTRPTISHSLHQSASHKWSQYINLILVDAEVKVSETYYHNTMLLQKFLPAVYVSYRAISSFSRTVYGRIWHARQSPFLLITSPDVDRLWTRISCRWQTHATRCITANVLQTNSVDAQCASVGVTPFEFCRDFLHQNTRVSGLLFGVICVILLLAVSVEHGQTGIRTDTRRQLIPAVANVAQVKKSLNAGSAVNR